MQIEVNETEYCKLQVHYEANLEEIELKKNEVVNIFKKASVPGFRKGKASTEAIKIYYKSQINESLKRALAEDAFHNTVFEKNIKPLGTPDFTSLLLHDSKFECDFKVHVKPDFVLGEYKGLEIPNPPQRTVTELTEEILQQLREQHGEQVQYAEDDFVQHGDSVIINYSASVDGEKIPSLCNEGEVFKVGSSSIKGFDDNLLGMNIGETRVFNLLAPEGSLPSVSNKEITFEVTVIMGKKTVPAPLNDDFAKTLGKENFDQLRETVVQIATGRSELQRKSAISSQISARLTENHDFKVPNWLALPEAQYLAKNARIEWDTLPDVDKEKFLVMGANNVKLSLILDKVREEEPDAQLSDQEVFSMLKNTFEKTNPGRNPDEVFKELAQTGYLQSLFVRVRDEHVLTFLAENAKIIE